MNLPNPKDEDLIYRHCPLCDNNNYCYEYSVVREFIYGPKVVRCSNCSLVYLNPVMSEKAYKEFYDNDLQRTFAQKITKDNYQSKISRDDINRYNLLKKYRERKLLDIGTGFSSFVGFMDNAVGIDISKVRVDNATQRGLDVKLCSIFNWQDKVEVATLFHVLEHIVDPNVFLKRIHSILEDDGVLIIEVPNLDDILVKLNNYKRFYYQNAHCSYFTPNTIKKLLKNNGFRVNKLIKLQRYSLNNHMHWLLKDKPGKFKERRLINHMYSGILKILNVYDTIFLICEKDK